MIAAYRNGVRIDALPLDSRAAHYGDGAFTTMRVQAGRVCWWAAHRARLDASCVALHLSRPDWTATETRIEQEAQALGSGVLKLALVPKSGGRGYARDWPSDCDVYLFVYALPAIDPATYLDGVVLDTVRLASMTTVGEGIKTLSRLEQVLAAPASSGRDVLVCDRDGFVRSASSANVFALFGSTWATPPDGHGVIAGVMRSTLLQSPPPGFSARVQCMHRDALDHADALVLCNAVRGVVPVRRLDERVYAHHRGVAALMRRFHPELGLPEA